jgi:hypothetical protein
MSFGELHGFFKRSFSVSWCFLQFVLIEKQKHPPADGTSTRPTLPFEYWQPIQARLLRQGSGNFPNKKYNAAITATGDITALTDIPPARWPETVQKTRCGSAAVKGGQEPLC